MNSESSFDWINFIATGGAILTGILAIIYANYQSDKNLKELRSKEKRENIQKKLDEFYGPLYQLRVKSQFIYEIFSKDYKLKDPSFSTLKYLLQGHKFTGNDEILLKQILEIGQKSENLIHEKAGLIDDTNLRSKIIPRATTHFLLLRLAYSGAITSDLHKFENYTFPQELDKLLEKRRTELINEITNL